MSSSLAYVPTTDRDDSDDPLHSDLQTIRLLRATFESARQLVEAVHADVTTMIGNCEALVDITTRWDEAIDIPEAGQQQTHRQ